MRTVLALLLLTAAGISALAAVQQALLGALAVRNSKAPRHIAALNRSGVSLVELLISVVIVGVGVLGLIGALGGVQKAVQVSKNKTLASNLAQEKMQILKQQSYYKVLVTTAPAYRTEFAPPVPYDSGYFAAETILEGGVAFRRLTYIQVAREDSGAMVTLPPSTPDTGMRLITINVTWAERGSERRVELKSVLANPDTVMANAIYNGTVLEAGSMAPITGALVNIAENVGWRDTSAAGGSYTIPLSPGGYAMMASAAGYFPQIRSVSIGPNQTQTEDFALVRMASGTVRGQAWLNDHLVISQVTGSSVDASGFSQEWVEVFNPTTWTWTVQGEVGLRFQRPADAGKMDILLDYRVSTIAAGGFFLFANTGTIHAGGAVREADAVWSPSNSLLDFPYFATQANIIPTSNQGGEGGGALELYRISNDAALDRFGWDRNGGGQPAPFFEADGLDQNIGLQVEEQYVRFSSTSGADALLGPAYDSGNNNIDWEQYNPLSLAPRNTTVPALTVVSGVPAAGAVVSSIDGLSASTVAVLSGSPPRASFVLTQVATGTWTVFVSSGAASSQNDAVTIAASGSLYDFPAELTVLDESNADGFISGTVTDVLGQPIPSPGIQVSPGGAGLPVPASLANGRYLLRVLPGVMDVTANQGNINSSYVSQSSQAVTVTLGQVSPGVNFLLSQGGRVQGFVTRDGINALPGVAVVAVDANGYSRDQQVSGPDGRFTMVNLTTGTYSIEPALSSQETSSPTARTVNVDIGATVSAGTFTITGALGTIAGAVTVGGGPLRTGVLVVVTTGTLTAPPMLSSAALTAAPYYVGSSQEDGTYRLDVRHSTSPAYRVYAYYSVMTGSATVSILPLSVSGVQVIAGGTTGGVNFAW